MKKNNLLNLMLVFLLIMKGLNTQAQYCGGSGPTVCTAPAVTGTPGLTPVSDSLPCFVKGVAATAKINFENFTTVSGLTVNWLRIDSISNLPPGLCWKTNSSTNTYNGGQTGCIIVSGTPTTSAAIGQYQLRIYVTVNLPFVGNVGADAASQGLHYFARLKQCSNAPCPSVDTTSQNSVYFKPYTALPTATASITPSGTINTCTLPVTLQANTGSGFTYKWSNGATTSSISVTTPNTYKVTVYGACGDSAVSSPVIVNTNALSSSLTPSGTGSICPGGSLLLSASSSLTGSSYEWYNGTTLISGANAATYSATAAGTYICRVTNGACVAYSDTIAVSVSSVGTAPMAITATDTLFCAGSTVTLNATVGFAHYLWSTGDTTASITVSSAGNYSVAGQITISGCNSYGGDSISITLKPTITAPIISPLSTTIIIGSPTTLSINNHTYSNYMWNTGATTSTISVTDCGTYSVTVFDNATCGYDSATVPITNSDLTCAIRDSVAGGYLYTMTLGGSSYKWYDATTNTVVSTNPVFFSPTVAGNYYLVLTKNNCTCNSNIVGMNVGISNIAIENLAVSVYPNPVNDKLNVTFTNDENLAISFSIQNLLGEKLNSFNEQNYSKGTHNLTNDISALSSGIYFLVVENNNKKAVYRFVKE